MKTSFVLHLDSLDVLDALNPEQCGQLLVAMREYHLTGAMPEDSVIKLALMPFLSQWKRDLVKFEKVCDRNRANGMKGGRPKNPVGFLETQKNPSEPKKAERESESESEKESESINKQRFSAPTLDDVKQFFTENGYTTEAATKAFNYYHEAGWRDSRGQTVKNWKQKMRGVWFRDEHKPQAQAAQASRNEPPKAIYTPPSQYRPA